MDNVSKDFTVINIIKTGLYGYVNDFPVDCDSIDVDDNSNIHKYLINKHDLKECLDLLSRCLLDYYV